MANGDITKSLEFGKIEVAGSWNIQIRQDTIILEEQADGSKNELSRAYNRWTLMPFNSSKDSDGKWTHTATEISGEHATVQAIANAAWTDAVKTAFKARQEELG